MLFEGDMHEVVHGDRIRNIMDISIKVAVLGKFYKSDIERNKIQKADECPDFVTDFVRLLDRKPRLEPVRRFIDLSVYCPILMGQYRDY